MGQFAKIEILQRPPTNLRKVSRANKSQANLTVPCQRICKRINDTICVAQRNSNRKELSIANGVSGRYTAASSTDHENRAAHSHSVYIHAKHGIAD